MGRWGWLVGLTVCLPLPVGAASLGPTDAWRATELNLNLSHAFISNEKCRSSERYSRSCANAIRAVGAILPDSPFDFTELPADLDYEKALRELSELAGANPSEVLGVAINAHLQTFDPHARLVPSAAATDSANEIGLTAQPTAAGLRVDEVFDGSLAQMAGLAFGDLITGIADELDRGRPAVHFMVNHDDKVRPVTLDRALYKVANVTAKYLGANVLNVRIRSFEDGVTCGEVQVAVAKLSQNSKLILDLRGNGGGSLDEAICVASLFLGMKSVVGIQPSPVKIPEAQLVPLIDDADSGTTEWRSGSSFMALKVPTVVLVDSGTASAAEILAGALLTYQAAWLVGEKTYGKGSAQTTNVWAEHPSLTLVATTGFYEFPNHTTNQGVGLNPSFVVPYRYDATADELRAPREVDDYPSDDSFGPRGQEWFDPRVKQIGALHTCLAAHPPAAEADDYQTEYARSLLKCTL